MGFPVFFVILVVIIIAAVAWYVDRLRQQMWREAAERYGLTYQRRDPFGIPNRYDEFALFQRGHSRKANHCLHGDYQERRVCLFDYRYTTGSGKNQSTHRLSALIMSVGLHCPYLIIRPEGFFDKIGDFLGFGDIDFEYEEFNKRFHVKGPEKRFAYDICHARAMEFLLEHPDLTWEMRGDELILYGLGTFDPREIEYCLRTATQFLELMPQYMREGGATWTA